MGSFLTAAAASVALQRCSSRDEMPNSD